MKQTGAQLVRHALEQLGVRYTFGIPGVHNTEIYDQISQSETVRPIRVTHECAGAFMADAISRTTDGVGTLLIVPAAGAAMASPGIGEAFMAGVPMIVISGGVRTDHGFRYQLHQMDQLAMVKPITKAQWRITEHRDIVPTLYEAWRVATQGEPGPVFVEIPVNVQLFPGEVEGLPPFVPVVSTPSIDAAAVERAAQRLAQARRPGIFVGWGAARATELVAALADRLGAPVGTTLQGLSVFPSTHPLHTGMGIGPAAVPAGENAFAECDVLLAVGTRFGEIATGSFGLKPTWSLIHVDIQPEVFGANYPAEIAIEGDARQVLGALLKALPEVPAGAVRRDAVAQAIARDKAAYTAEWLAHDNGHRVNPARFFTALRTRLPDDGYLVTDDGNHTFLVAELFGATRSGHVFSPSDFNCMGYCVPAAIGTKLAHRDREVVGVVGDGAFLMTGLEILTASQLQLGVVLYVFNDGELSQISQAQTLPYNKKVCTVLPEVSIKGIADATGASYLAMDSDASIAQVIERAHAQAAQGRPVVVDVRIDYSKATRFTKGILRTNFDRLSLGNKARMVARAAWRRISPPQV
ncbi:MAG TPA: thiamine pyrophosphate-binding protein [Aquabacterium sp.]|uniref:thiamine pyrophosphate-binding protein n=1 Tax=Aquabacterium sp. TaxID=1872578 RepID=UPI002E368C3C|nr:thiamine pyrophosphate-binding protein [Aquabacterium sp.]HEX5373766.1 thiamine pyrophosphate-binding protein [Aquabacterium sp.]